MAPRLALLGLGSCGLAAAGLFGGEDVTTMPKVLAEVNGVRWESCADVGSLFRLENATFDPYTFTVTASGVLSQAVTGGQVQGEPHLGRAPPDATRWEIMRRKVAFAAQKRIVEEELCQQLGRTGLKCPLAAGRQKLAFSLARGPSRLVAGELGMELRASDQDGRPVACLKGLLRVRRGVRGELFRLLETPQPKGPCLHGNEFMPNASTGAHCMSHSEWQGVYNQEQNRGMCLQVGGRWDQANFDGDGNGCKFDDKAKCEAAKFTWKELTCQWELESKGGQYEQILAGKMCKDVKVGGETMEQFVSHQVEKCCGDKRTVCDLNRPTASGTHSPAAGMVVLASAMWALFGATRAMF